jgi:hypothetical protein
VSTGASVSAHERERKMDPAADFAQHRVATGRWDLCGGTGAPRTVVYPANRANFRAFLEIDMPERTFRETPTAVWPMGSVRTREPPPSRDET